MGRVGTASRPSFQYGVRPLLTDINRKRSDPILNPACYPSALGRDGSQSRPFAAEDPHLIRLDGGLGEPALPETEPPDTPHQD